MVLIQKPAMTHLLHIDSSPRSQRSRSRQISQEFVQKWQLKYPDDTITYRDIGHHPVPHLNELWIAAAYTPAEQRTPELWSAIETSDRLVDEFLAADKLHPSAKEYAKWATKLAAAIKTEFK